MFRLTDVQTKILRACFDIQTRNPNDIHCITSYTLRKENIAGRTFDINKDELLFHHLLHVQEKIKTGKQIRTYYGITPFGFFCLLKSLVDSGTSTFGEYAKYIPFIGEKWKKYESILKPYDYLLPRILSRSLNELNVLPYYKYHTKDKKFKFRVEESTELNFEDYGGKITATRFYPDSSQNKGIKSDIFLKKALKVWQTYFHKDFIKLAESTVDQLVFLFYFNSFKLKYDDRYGFHLFGNQNWSDRYKETKFIPKKIQDDGEKMEDIEGRIRKIWDDYDEFWRTKRIDFLNETADDVFNDKDLSLTFIERFLETTSIFRTVPNTIKQLDLIIKNHMISLGIEQGLIEEKTITTQSGKEFKYVKLKNSEHNKG